MRGLRGLVAVLVAGMAMPALAQSNDGPDTPLGSRIGRERPAQVSQSAGLSDEVRALRVVFDYADCVVERDEKILRPMLSLEPIALNERQTRALSQPRCLLGGNLTMPTPIIRGAIFRTFYLQDYGADAIQDFGPAVDYFQFVDRQNPVQVRTALMLDFASCVVRADQANARSMVRGTPGERQFEDAMRALVPQLGACIPQGLKVEINRSTLSAYLAEALYWEAKAAADAPQVSTQ